MPIPVCQWYFNTKVYVIACLIPTQQITLVTFLLFPKFTASTAYSFGNMCILTLFYKLVKDRYCFFLMCEHPIQCFSVMHVANAV